MLHFPPIFFFIHHNSPCESCDITIVNSFLTLQLEALEGEEDNISPARRQQLVQAAMNYLVKEGHTNVKPFYDKEVVGPYGRSREIDAGAIADDCVVVVKYTRTMDKMPLFYLPAWSTSSSEYGIGIFCLLLSIGFLS